MIFAVVLSTDGVPSGLRTTGAGARRKTGWLGHATGDFCHIMWLLRDKGLLLAVRPEAVAGDSNGVNVVTIVVRINDSVSAHTK